MTYRSDVSQAIKSAILAGEAEHIVEADNAHYTALGQVELAYYVIDGKIIQHGKWVDTFTPDEFAELIGEARHDFVGYFGIVA